MCIPSQLVACFDRFTVQDRTTNHRTLYEKAWCFGTAQVEEHIACTCLIANKRWPWSLAKLMDYKIHDAI
jgi:hypothetical protein